MVAKEIANLIAKLPDPKGMSPEEYFTTVRDTIGKTKWISGPYKALGQIEYESWQYTEPHFDNWLEIIEFFRDTIEKTAAELEVLVRIYSYTAEAILGTALAKAEAQNGRELDK